MLAYRENNIIFRIASANAISKFKEVQAHSFLQVCRKEFDFDQRAREVLLLSYDRFSAWVLSTERAFLMLDDRVITEQFCMELLSSIREQFDSILETTTTHQDIFDAQVSEFLEIIFAYSLKVFAKEIGCYPGMQITAAFADIVHLTSDFLQHILVAVHEFNNNCVKKQLGFLCITDFGKLGAELGSCSPITERAVFFRSYCSKQQFTIKNYTNDENIVNLASENLHGVGIETHPEALVTA